MCKITSTYYKYNRNVLVILPKENLIDNIELERFEYNIMFATQNYNN